MNVRPDIEALIREGHSNAAIARQLHVATKTVRATRTALDLPPSQHGHPHGLTLEQTWQARTQPVDGGHLEWDGQHNSHGVPILNWHGKRHSAYRIAYRIRTGREPVGKVKPSCEHPGCVAPEHVDDDATRQRDRAAMRAVLGMPPRPTRCPHGHDQAVHGRLKGNNVHYCTACDTGQQAA